MRHLFPLLFAALVVSPVHAQDSELSPAADPVAENEIHELADAAFTRAVTAAQSVRGNETRARAYLAAGRPDDALPLVPALLERGSESDQYLAAEVLIANAQYQELQSIAGLFSETSATSDMRLMTYRWKLLTDDYAGLDAALARATEAGFAGFPEQLMRAELLLQRDDLTAAEAAFLALTGDLAPHEQAFAASGLGRTYLRLLDYDRGIDVYRNAIASVGADSDLLTGAGDTFIRLGRTDEAIAAFELAVKVSPYNDRPHYMLGNGYARKNYTQLYAAYPQRLAGDAGAATLAPADQLFAAGEYPAALAAYNTLDLAHPSWAEIPGRLGSLAFMQGDFVEARAQFMESLRRCPEYGRAHNGLSKVIEAQRMQVEVHRAGDQARFDALDTPHVEGLDTFVVNWKALSPRHQKQVALACQPWERFIPVLVEAGATYYIKPLHELLSQTPGQPTLRDQRINYDSRLWDDVRGCGGYHTVTGIEDVERSIFNRYNTVLHELTHQVHGVLPSDRSRSIQELYRLTKVREEAGEKAFLSRYAGGSVWEYFAEGANSLFSPQRDAYDFREVVLEKLDERDPPLRRLVADIMENADVDSCYVVGYVNRGYQAIETNELELALGSFHEALERDKRSEEALSAQSYVLLLMVPESRRGKPDQYGQQFEVSDHALKTHPESATIVLQHATTLRHGGRSNAAVRVFLNSAREKVTEADRYRVDLEIGRLAWLMGDAVEATAAYERVLAYQADNPEGLWGLAQARALAEDWDRAWELYEEVVRLRTGVVGLRLDYAVDLLRAGKVKTARDQVSAALLLDEEDPRVLAVDALVLDAEGNSAGAAGRAREALALGTWCDMAVVALTRALDASGEAQEAARVSESYRNRLQRNAAPEFVYRSKWGRFDEVRQLPVVERGFLPESLQ